MAKAEVVVINDIYDSAVEYFLFEFFESQILISKLGKLNTRGIFLSFLTSNAFGVE